MVSSKFTATQTRNFLRGSITKLHNDRTNFSSYDSLKLEQLKLKRDKLESDVAVANQNVFQLLVSKDAEDEAGFQAEMEFCDIYTDKLLECRVHLEAALSSRAVVPGAGAGATVPTADVADGRGGSHYHSGLKAPMAPLPKFTSGEGENFNLFLSQFEDTISKFNYTDYDKLLLLKQQISGRASLLINTLKLKDKEETYDNAKELLSSALASTEVQKFNIIRQMRDLRLSYNGEPFEYIANVRAIMQSIESLKISVDDILGFFVYDGLNDAFKNQLTLVTNSTWPTLEEFNKNFFIANERYELSGKVSKNSSKTSVNAENISVNFSKSITAERKNPFDTCTLCVGAPDHGINKCKKFPKARDKLSRLRSLSGCSRCGNIDHTTDGCKFRLKKSCIHCRKWHFSFLCPEDGDYANVNGFVSSQNKNQTRVKSSQNFVSVENSLPVSGDRETVCNVTCANYFQDNLENIDTVLPTFTVEGKGASLIRGLYDTGSQSNFVEESSLSKIVYKIIKNNVNLTIKGINDVKRYRTKLIETAIAFGSKSFKVQLLVVPSIDITLEIPNLHVAVQHFAELGFDLADARLNSESTRLDDIGILLGSNASYCFEGRTIKFGNSSAYIDTKNGVMLLGRVSDMVSDFSSLERLVSESKNYHSSCNLNVASFAIGLGFALESKTLATTAKDPVDYQLAIKNVSETSFDSCADEVLEDTRAYHLNREGSEDTVNSETNINAVRYLFDLKYKFLPKTHTELKLGDIVLIKEDNTKQTNFPMGRIVSLTQNDLGEVTGAVILKGSTGERVKRHASVLIPLLQDVTCQTEQVPVPPQQEASSRAVRPRRGAAARSETRTRDMLSAQN